MTELEKLKAARDAAYDAYDAAYDAARDAYYAYDAALAAQEKEQDND